MNEKLYPKGEDVDFLRIAERIGRTFREEKLAWEQSQWAKNNATLSWRAAGPLRAAEGLLKRLSRSSPVNHKKRGDSAPPIHLSPASGTMPSKADTRLSVIIPTLNAGAGFEALLQLLRRQAALPKLEIVVVDSGSSDKTVPLAKQYGAVVVSISKNEFTHAHARNLGAQQATGDYLLFMTQDALPENELWARSLLHPLLHNTVQAVTCVEKPRLDADLYSLVAGYQYERDLGRAHGSDFIGTMPAQESYSAMMQNAGLSNVACAMSAELFAKYRFRGYFAEDLDLGVRLIRDGDKIGFLSSVPVIHSHSRPPFYYLKRACVNASAVPQILPVMPLPSLSLPQLIFSALGTLQRLVAYVHFLSQRKGDKIDTPQLLGRSRDFFSGMSIMGYSYQSEPPPAITGDDGLDDVIRHLWRLSSKFSPIEMDLSDVFMQNLENSVFEYLIAQGTILSDELLTQIGDVVLKRFAIWLGEGIAAVAKQEKALSPLKGLAESLCQNI